MEKIIIEIILAVIFYNLIEKFLIKKYDIWEKLASKLGKKSLNIIVFIFFIMSAIVLSEILDKLWGDIVLFGLIFPFVLSYRLHKV